MVRSFNSVVLAALPILGWSLTYRATFYNGYPSAEKVCFVYADTEAKILASDGADLLTVGPLSYKDIVNVDYTITTSTLYYNVFAWTSGACPKTGTSLISGAKSTPLQDENVNTFGYAPTSSGAGGYDVWRDSSNFAPSNNEYFMFAVHNAKGYSSCTFTAKQDSATLATSAPVSLDNAYGSLTRPYPETSTLTIEATCETTIGGTVSSATVTTDLAPSDLSGGSVAIVSAVGEAGNSEYQLSIFNVIPSDPTTTPTTTTIDPTITNSASSLKLWLALTVGLTGSMLAFIPEHKCLL